MGIGLFVGPSLVVSLTYIRDELLEGVSVIHLTKFPTLPVIYSIYYIQSSEIQENIVDI